MSGPRPAWGEARVGRTGGRSPAPRPDLPGVPLGNAASWGGGVPGHRATEILGRSWLRSGEEGGGREAGGPAIVQEAHFCPDAAGCYSEEGNQTEGLSSPPSGLGAAALSSQPK